MKRLSDRFGRRGMALITLGGIWCLFGIGLIVAPEREALHPGAIHELIPGTWRGVAWLVTGILAIVVGLRGRRADDTAGHVALWIMPGIRLLSFVGAWLLWLGSTVINALGGHIDATGDAGSWAAAGVWLMVTALLRVIAEWPDPAVFAPPRTEEEAGQ